MMRSDGADIKYMILENPEAGQSLLFQYKQVLKSHSTMSKRYPCYLSSLLRFMKLAKNDNLGHKRCEEMVPVY